MDLSINIWLFWQPQYYQFFSDPRWVLKKKKKRDIFSYAKSERETQILYDIILQGEYTSHPKGNQLWKFTGRLDAEAEAPILWPPDAKSQLIGKDSDPGKDWRQKEKGVTEGEMVGWHHRLNGREFEKASGNSGGQRSLVCCSPWTSTGGSFFWEPCSTLSIPFTRLSTSPSQEMCSSSLCNLRVLHVTSDMEEMWKQGQWYHKIKSDKGDQK